MIFISPPFGNYILTDKTISIKGSYTLYPRHGLLSRIIKTLRYSRINNGWINQIGLRNPGVDYAIQDFHKRQMNLVYNPKNANVIYSVAILNQNEIPILVHKIPVMMNLELNISCPNVKSNKIVTGIEQFINPKRRWCILKLAPTIDTKEIDQFYQKGFRQFHCSNTIKTESGGLSGPSLRPYTTHLVKYIREKYPDAVIIAGGGIQNQDDINNYRNVGADHFSISTVFFNPFKTIKLFWDFN